MCTTPSISAAVTIMYTCQLSLFRRDSPYLNPAVPYFYGLLPLFYGTISHSALMDEDKVILWLENKNSTHLNPFS